METALTPLHSQSDALIEVVASELPFGQNSLLHFEALVRGHLARLQSTAPAALF
jgi:hypothetical protein